MSDQTEEIDDDLYEPPPGPSPNELRRAAAERGDVDFFLDIFRNKSWSLFSVAEMLKHLMRACEVASRADPEGYAADTFARMVGLNSFLLLRTQIYAVGRVVGRGPFPTTPALADLQPDVVERLLPRLVEMQRATGELLVAQAQAGRLWGLARAKQAQAGRATPPDERRDRPSPPAGEAVKPRSGGAVAEGEEPRADVVPIRGRGRRRG